MNWPLILSVTSLIFAYLNKATGDLKDRGLPYVQALERLVPTWWVCLERWGTFRRVGFPDEVCN